MKNIRFFIILTFLFACDNTREITFQELKDKVLTDDLKAEVMHGNEEVLLRIENKKRIDIFIHNMEKPVYRVYLTEGQYDSIMDSEAKFGGFPHMTVEGGSIFFLDFLPLSIVVLVVIQIIFLVDILIHKFKDTNDKLVWLLAVVLLPVLGVVMYFFIGRKQKLITSSTD